MQVLEYQNNKKSLKIGINGALEILFFDEKYGWQPQWFKISNLQPAEKAYFEQELQLLIENYEKMELTKNGDLY